MVPIDNEFGEGYPGQEQDCERGKSDSSGQLDKGDLFHGQSFSRTKKKSVPVQAHLKSSAGAGIGIGAMARLAGVRQSAIRYYEACGLIPAPGRRSGRRVYDSADLNRLRLIVIARQLGFPIADLKEIALLDPSELQAVARRKATFFRNQIAVISRSAEILDRLADCECRTEQECLLTQR